MPGGRGSKRMSDAAKERVANSPSVQEALAKGQDALKLRFRGRLATAEAVKLALADSISAYLETIDVLARGASDPRVALDAARYLIDRVAGKPTEKVQAEISAVPAVMPSDEQLETLAKRALEGPKLRDEGAGDAEG